MGSNKTKRCRAEQDGRCHHKRAQHKHNQVQQHHEGDCELRDRKSFRSSHDSSLDRELDEQLHWLQATLRERVQNIKQREAAQQHDNRLLQQRLQEVQQREKLLKDQEDELQLRRQSIQQMQQDMLHQYNNIAASLPKLEERISSAQRPLQDIAEEALHADAQREAPPLNPVVPNLQTEALQQLHMQAAELPKGSHSLYPAQQQSAAAVHGPQLQLLQPATRPAVHSAGPGIHKVLHPPAPGPADIQRTDTAHSHQAEEDVANARLETLHAPLKAADSNSTATDPAASTSYPAAHHMCAAEWQAHHHGSLRLHSRSAAARGHEPMLVPAIRPSSNAHPLKPVSITVQSSSVAPHCAASSIMPCNRAPSPVIGRTNEVGVGSPSSNSSSRGALRQRGTGRGRGRPRGASSMHHTGFSTAAGDLDEAVQALKATTVACQPRNTLNSRHSDCNSPPDDDLKPAFMRHAPAEHSPVLYNTLSASAGTHSSFAPAQAVTAGNGARLSARHHGDPTVRASAKEVLQKEVPDLLNMLEQKGLAGQVTLLEDPANGLTAPSNVYNSMHNILARVCGSNTSSWHACIATGSKTPGEVSGRHEYCLMALEHLLERTTAFRNAKQPVQWGWCRQIFSFVFVFEAANRIAVEKPCYGHATYFFDLEEPLPVSDQVQRLIAVLSIPSVNRRQLLEDCFLDPGPDLTAQDQRQLLAAGDRIFHQHVEGTNNHKPACWNATEYRDKIARVLSEGASGGRITKIC